ncbi:methionine synthase [Prevotella sp. E13-27]|uniref:methionine synthase n=1 Tax=Prevotella sp. E13-27 TaxID=2938122 RepID=UPI002009DC39|nr:methionine synthase [Prevotella sp. E13-27]MCK8623723.1 methionine synthase [Prevotella sp. E13-27]
MKRLFEIIKERVLILDGAMGTVIQEYGLNESDFRAERFIDTVGTMKGNNDILCLTRPDIISDIHERYLKAGANIITTNTFNAQRISQGDYHMESFAREMNLEGARLARKAADKYSTDEQSRFVAGSVGPTNKTCSMSPDVSDPAARELTYDELFEAYTEQMEALIEGGVDTLLIETIFDSLNAKVAIDAAMQAMKHMGRELPIMLSVTVSDLAGRTLSGQTLDAFLASVDSYPIFSIGLNCSFGAQQMKPFLKELAQRAPYYISAYPNAGLPNSMGLYDETPETMAPQIGEFIDEGLVNIVGGCCGTTPAFIKRYVPLTIGKQPHKPAPIPQNLWLSGLDMLELTSDILFVNVGERCNVAGSRKFLRLIKEKKYDEAISIARNQTSDGALVIDINMDDGMLNAREEMVTFLNMIAGEPDIAKVPFMLDSSDWQVIVSGLKCVQGKCIVNSISLKEGEEVFKSHARDVMRYGAAVVVMCFDEEGQATTYERRIAIAERAYHILTQQVGMNPQNIIFDPNILAIATGMEEHDSYALDFIRATKWIRENLPGAHVSGGVSNLSFSFRGNNYIREAMHAVFLYHAIQAGMDFGIVNPATKIQYADIPQEELDIIEDVVLNRKKGAAERLINLAAQLNAAEAASKGSSSDNNSGIATSGAEDKSSVEKAPLSERLSQALIRGIGDNLEADLNEALKEYPRAVDIIEGPLMAGMNEVGKRFGEGKMFLPQVVKTARTMKQAVAILQPHIEAQQTSGTKKAGKVLLATVKGDVHDIGKNIVAVVMACNNYEVIDMGVMVPAEQIVKKALEEKVDIIGLSGLITPSLEEMVNVARELQHAGISIPIMIGGATTSELHVALKIAPVYGGPVIWMKDASQNPIVAARLMSDEKAIEQEMNDTYEHLRQEYDSQQQELTSLEEARKKKPNLWE